MSPTSDDLLKRLKPTKSFAVDASHIRVLAQLAIELGSEEFAKRWAIAIAAKARKRGTKTPKDDALAQAKADVTKFGAQRGLSSTQTAQAIYRYAKSQRRDLSSPTKTSQKGVSSMVDWLAKSSDVTSVKRLISSFCAEQGPGTNLAHRLHPEEA